MTSNNNTLVYASPVRVVKIDNKLMRFYECDECRIEYSLNAQQYYQRVKRSNPSLCFKCLDNHRKKAIISRTRSRSKDEIDRINKILSKKAKERISKMSEDELSKHGKKIWDSRKKNAEELKDHKIEELKQKAKIEYDKKRVPMLKRLKDASTNYWSNISDEEKEKIYSDPIRSKKISDSKYQYWESIDEETKSKIMEKCLKGGEEYRNNLTEEEYRIVIERLQEGRRLWYDNMPQEEKDAMHKRISEGRINYWKNLTDEEREALLHKMSVSMKEVWESHSDDKKQTIIDSLLYHAQEFRNNMTPDMRKSINNKISEKRKLWWDNLTMNERFSVISNMKIANSKAWDDALKSHMVGPTEVDFVNHLSMYDIPYTWGYINIISHDDFYNAFPRINPYTLSYNFSYHQWDFITYGNRNILIDIDGSIHDPSRNNFNVTTKKGTIFNLGENISFGDSQRIYQTDGFDAYIVLAYNDKLEDETVVIHLNTNNEITYKMLLDILMLNQLNDNDVKKMFKIYRGE